VAQTNHVVIAMIVAAAAAMGLAGCQSTGAPTYSPVAVSGVPLKLAHFTSLNADCSSIGDTVVRVTKNPDHGVVMVQKGSGYSYYPAANPHSQCNLRPTAGTNLTYVSSPGYTGPDSVAVDAIYPSGGESHATFNLTVK
jgi:hypothetical protein